MVFKDIFTLICNNYKIKQCIPCCKEQQLSMLRKDPSAHIVIHAKRETPGKYFKTKHIMNFALKVLGKTVVSDVF